MSGRTSVDVIRSLVFKMFRFIVLSCCVVMSMCDVFKNCGKNEEMKCVQPCPPQKTCRNRDVKFSCLQSVQPCHHICVCKPGLLRNAVGTCITNEDCESEDVVKGSSIKPKDGARVRRNSNLTDCVIPEKPESLTTSLTKGYRIGCGESICTGENEVHTDCKKSCPPNTCLSIVARFKCDSTEPCKKGCLCKPGYLRQQPDSPCIPICQCSQMKYSPDCGLHDSATKE